MSGRIKTSLVNLAQILLLFLIIPVFVMICEALSPFSSASGLISFLSQGPLFEPIADILSQYVSGITTGDIAQLTLWVFFKELPAAMIAGVSVHFCIAVFDFIWQPLKLTYKKSFKPLPILPGFLGIFLSTIITNVIGLTGSALVSFIIEFGVVIIMIFGIRLMFSALKLPKNFFSLFNFLEWIIDGIFAVILSIYVVSAVFIMRGGFGDVWKDLSHILLMSLITMIAAVVVSLVKLGKD